MNTGDLVVFRHGNDDIVGLVISTRLQPGGHDYPKALVLWRGHEKPYWEKTESLLRINEVRHK